MMAKLGGECRSPGSFALSKKKKILLPGSFSGLSTEKVFWNSEGFKVNFEINQMHKHLMSTQVGYFGNS